MSIDGRIDYFGNPLGGKVLRQINSASVIVGDSTLPATTQELVKIRASQINGCGFCIDMHTKEALAGGETQHRLNLIAGWRDAAVFSEPERVALELAEEGTRIAGSSGGVSDEVWELAVKHYDVDQLAALISLIGLINAYNRINVISRQPAGEHMPGHSAEPAP